MNRYIYRFLLFFAILPGPFALYGIIPGFTGYGHLKPCQQDTLIQQDILIKNQILYNGMMWRNLYINVKGDQFIFSKEFLQGSLTLNGCSKKNILINYDIYNDELLTLGKNGSIIQLNKEMVDSFTLVFTGKTHRFVNIQEDSLPGIKGYAKLLYRGKSALYVKYKKAISVLAVDDKYDLFYPTTRIYFMKEGKVHQISSKNDLLKVLHEDKIRIKDFIKKNRLKVSIMEPESFITVIRYYDSLSR
jgi:hypothetical protein